MVHWVMARANGTFDLFAMTFDSVIVCCFRDQISRPSPSAAANCSQTYNLRPNDCNLILATERTQSAPASGHRLSGRK